MSASRESTEWHLTPRGWEAGTTKLDGTTNERPTPEDCVLTEKYEEVLSSIFSKPTNKHVGEVWRSKDAAEVERLIKEFGQCPRMVKW